MSDRDVHPDVDYCEHDVPDYLTCGACAGDAVPACGQRGCSGGSECPADRHLGRCVQNRPVLPDDQGA